MQFLIPFPNVYIMTYVCPFKSFLIVAVILLLGSEIWEVI